MTTEHRFTAEPAPVQEPDPSLAVYPGYDTPRGIPCCTTNLMGYRCGCPNPARLNAFRVDPYIEYRVTSMQGRSDAYARSITDDYPQNQTTRAEVEERRKKAAAADLARPVSPRFPAPGRSDRALPETNGRK